MKHKTITIRNEQCFVCSGHCKYFFNVERFALFIHPECYEGSSGKLIYREEKSAKLNEHWLGNRNHEWWESVAGVENSFRHNDVEWYRLIGEVLFVSLYIRGSLVGTYRAK